MDPNQQPVQPPEDSLNAVSAEVVQPQASIKPKSTRNLKRWDIILPVVSFAALVILGGIVWRVWAIQKHNQELAKANSQSVNLGDISASSSSFQVSDSNKVVINGLLSANQGLVLQPTDVPATPQLGQIYIDSKGVMHYFDGKKFVAVTGGQGTTTNNINNITNVTNISNEGVNSLQGLNGKLTLSGSNGLTVTNSSTNLQINLPQNLATSASPSFTGLSVTGGSLTLDNSSGSIIQAATGQDLTISSNNSVLTFISGGRTFILPTSGASTQTICTTGISCASGGGQAVLLAPGSAQTNASNSAADSSIFINNTGSAALLQLQSDGTDVLTVASNGDTYVGGNLTVNNITPNASLTVGSTGQSLTLQGNASSIFKVTGGGFTSTVGFTGSPVGNVTYNFDRTVAAGTYSICTTAGTSACTAVYAPSSGSGNYIQNQNSTDQTANFRISGTGQANTSILTPIVDTATATALNIGSTTATSITVGSTTETGTITVGRSTASNTINVGTAAGSGSIQTINVGTSATAGSTTNISIGSSVSGTTAIQSANGLYVGNGVSSASPAAGTIQGTTSSVSGTAGGNLTVRGGAGNGSGAGGTLYLRGGTSGGSSAGGNVEIYAASGGGGNNNGGNVIISAGEKSGSGSNGSVIVRPITSDSSNAFQIQNTSTDPIFMVGTVPPNNMVSNGNLETNATGWSAKNGSTISRTTAHAYFGTASLQVVTPATANAGAQTSISFVNGTSYSFTVYARASSSFSTLRLGHVDGGVDSDCTGGFFGTVIDNSVSSSGWQYFSCTFTASSTTAIYVKQSDASARTFYIDNAAVQASATGTHSAAAGTINFNSEVTSPLLIQPTEDSNTALHVMSSNGYNVLNVDTLNQQVQASSSTSTALVGLSLAAGGVQGVTANSSSYGVSGIGFAAGGGVSGSGSTLASGLFQNFSNANTSATLVTKLANTAGQTSDLFQAQDSSGNSLLGINTSGNLVFSSAQHSITVNAQSTSNTQGNTLSIAGSQGNGTGVGGSVIVSAGAAGTTGNVNGGSLYLLGGAGNGSGTYGDILLQNVTNVGIGNVLIGDGSTAGARLQVSSSTASVNLFKVTDATSSSVDVLTIADEGATTFRNRTNSTTAFRIQNASSTSLFTVDSTNSQIQLQGGGGVTISTLGTANTSTYLCRNSSNVIATCSTGVSGSAFIQGGNSFGATATLGTTDSNNLSLITNGVTRWTLDTAGNITIAAASSGGPITHTLSVGQAASSTSGDNLTIAAGAGNGSGTNGGALTLQSGATGTGNANGGNISIVAANGNGFGTGGNTTLSAGTIAVSGTAASLSLTGTAFLTPSAATLSGGNWTASSAVTAGGAVTIQGGNASGTSSTGNGGAVTINGGSSIGGTGGSISIQAGAGSLSTRQGGDLTLTGTSVASVSSGGQIKIAGSNTTAAGAVTISGAITTAGQDGGAVTISGGNYSESSGINNGGALTLQGGSAGGTGNTGNGGAVSIQGGTTVGGNVGNISIGSNAGSNTIQIGTTSTNTGKTQTINIGNLNAAGTTNITIGTGSTATAGTTTVQAKGALTLQGGAASTWDIGNNTLSLQTANNGAITTGAGALTLGGNVTVASNKSLTANGDALFQDATDSSSAFQIQNSSSDLLFGVDTTGNGAISIQTNTNGTIDIGTANITAVTIGKSGGSLEVYSDTIFYGNVGTFGTLVVASHIVSANVSGTTTISAGAAACTSPTVSISGNDTSGTATITTGTGCSGGGTLATITFAINFGAIPRVILTAAETNAAALQYYNGTNSTSTFKIETNTSPTNSTTYKFNYLVVQ